MMEEDAVRDELNDNCKEELAMYSASVVLPVVMGLMVSVINMILEAVIKGMSKFMRPKSYTEELVNIQK